MNPDLAIEFGQEAALNSLTLVAPMLIVGILVAIVIGLLQSMTQIQDQTVSFVPKIVFIVLTFVFCLPWLSGRLVDYSKELLERPHFLNLSSSTQNSETDIRESSLQGTDKIARTKIR